MMLILSRPQALVATATVLAVLAMFPARTQTLPPGTINVEHWPQDVPCRALKRYPDGTWEITVPYTLYLTLHRRATFKGEAIAAYFERKCRWRAK
jgi:hypothetical protein